MIHPIQICPADNLKSIDLELFNTVYAILPMPIDIKNSKNKFEDIPNDKVFVITMKDHLALQKLELTTYNITGILLTKGTYINLN